MSDGKLTLTRIVLAYLLAKFTLEVVGGLTKSELISSFYGVFVLLIFLFLLKVFTAPKKLPISQILNFHSKSMTTRRWFGTVVMIVMLSILVRVCILFFVIDVWAILDWEYYKNTISTMVDSNEGLAPTKLSLFQSVLITPIVEEIVYRGFLLSYLIARYRAVVALLLSAIIFGLMHGDMLSAFMGGLYFGFIYLIYRNLIFCMIAHVTINLLVSSIKTTFLSTYWTNLEFSSLEKLMSSTLIQLPVIIYLAVIVTLITFYRKRHIVSPFPSSYLK